MQLRRASFIELVFGHPHEKKELFTLVLINQFDLKRFEVRLPHDWESQVDDVDREYLSEMIREWTSLSKSKWADLRDDLCSLVQGPLRAIGSGDLSESECLALIERIEKPATRQ